MSRADATAAAEERETHETRTELNNEPEPAAAGEHADVRGRDAEERSQSSTDYGGAARLTLGERLVVELDREPVADRITGT